MKTKNIVTFFITFLLVSCLSVPVQIATETTEPTDTLLPATATSTPKPTLTKTATATPTETPIPTRTFAPIPSERPNDDQISGTYKLDRGADSYCALRAVLQPFVPPYQEVAVELFCLGGPPAYNSGSTSPKKILMSNNIAVYSVPEDYFYDNPEFMYLESDAPCHFVLQFDYNTVKVTQLGSDFSCGFGHGVYANGVYKLVDAKPPVLGCISIWDACSAEYPVP